MEHRFLSLKYILIYITCAGSWIIQVNGQVKDFPVNETSNRISFSGIIQDIDITSSEIESSINEWIRSFYEYPQDYLDNQASGNGRIFLKAHSVFPVNSVENGDTVNYTIRMNYDLRFFIHDADLRYEITNISYGTLNKPELLDAEVLFDEWHLNASKADANTTAEKLNIENSYRQYKTNTQLAIKRISETIQSAVLAEDQNRITGY